MIQYGWQNKDTYEDLQLKLFSTTVTTSLQS